MNISHCSLVLIGNSFSNTSGHLSAALKFIFQYFRSPLCCINIEPTFLLMALTKNVLRSCVYIEIDHLYATPFVCVFRWSVGHVVRWQFQQDIFLECSSGQILYLSIMSQPTVITEHSFGLLSQQSETNYPLQTFY